MKMEKKDKTSRLSKWKIVKIRTKREGHERKKNAKWRGRVKEDNSCITWIYVSVEMQKRFTQYYECTQQMYLVFLIWKKNLRQYILHYSHSELSSLHLNQCRLVLSINFTTTTKIHKNHREISRISLRTLCYVQI